MKPANILELVDGMNWDQSQDHYLQEYTSPQAYAWYYVNAVIEQNWLAYDGGRHGPLDEERLAECLVEIHNECVERLMQGTSPIRLWAVIDDVRLRLRGLLTPDVTLIAWTGLQPLPMRPTVPVAEPRPRRPRVIPFRPNQV